MMSSIYACEFSPAGLHTRLDWSLKSLGYLLFDVNVRPIAYIQAEMAYFSMELFKTFPWLS